MPVAESPDIFTPIVSPGRSRTLKRRADQEPGVERRSVRQKEEQEDEGRDQRPEELEMPDIQTEAAADGRRESRAAKQRPAREPAVQEEQQPERKQPASIGKKGSKSVKPTKALKTASQGEQQTCIATPGQPVGRLLRAPKRKAISLSPALGSTNARRSRRQKAEAVATESETAMEEEAATETEVSVEEEAAMDEEMAAGHEVGEVSEGTMHNAHSSTASAKEVRQSTRAGGRKGAESTPRWAAKAAKRTKATAPATKDAGKPGWLARASCKSCLATSRALSEHDYAGKFVIDSPVREARRK